MKPRKLQSIYQLLLQADDKPRTRFEILVYAILIANSVFAVARVI